MKNLKTQNHKTSRRKHKHHLFLTLVLAGFLFVSSGKGNKSKNTQVGLHQSEKLLHSEGNHKQSKEAAY